MPELLIAGDWTAAEALLAPLAARPDAPVAVVYNHGKVLIELGRSREAVAALRRVCAQAPDRDARRNLGRVALQLGQWEAARAAWEGLGEDDEAGLALDRIAAETGAPGCSPPTPTARRVVLALRPKADMRRSFGWLEAQGLAC